MPHRRFGQIVGYKWDTNEDKVITNRLMNAKKARILVLEDDPELHKILLNYYTPKGYELICHEDPTVTLSELAKAKDPTQICDVVVTNLQLPQIDGLELIKRIKSLAPELPIILMTAHNKLETAVKGVDAGAYDFLLKPLQLPLLDVSVSRALQFKRLKTQNEALRIAAKTIQDVDGVIGKSSQIRQVFDLAKRVAKSTATILITGESGTGKELVARAIHYHSDRSKGPFVAINCSAIPENLLESELFGHAKGSFTGAHEKKLGLFEEAEGGILFLDEIGDLNLPLQAKLLRVLQEKKIKRVGENQMRAIDCRILAATHKDLLTEIREGRFREDLYFRLNVIPIRIPPLRERKEDILPLAEHFLKKYAAENDCLPCSFSKQALELLLQSPWPGNVRELENAIERAVVLSDCSVIGAESFPPLDHVNTSPSAELLSEISNLNKLPTLDEFNLEYIKLVLRNSGGVKDQAARILGIDRKTLYRRTREINNLSDPTRSVPLLLGNASL